MERDLHELMRAALDADESTLAGVATEGPLTRALSGVRRRRRARHTQQTMLGVAVVAVLGLSAVLGGSFVRHDAPPVHTPSPEVSSIHGPTATSSPSPVRSSTPEPSGTPSSSPTSAPTSTPTEVAPLAEGSGLPPHRPLTAGVLAAAGAGWVVGDFLNLVDDSRATFVAAPSGEVYRAADATFGPQREGVRLRTLVRWPAGAPYAVITFSHGDSFDRGLIDLLTGTVTTDGRGLPQTEMTFVGLAADGAEVWSHPRDGVWMLPLDGRARLVFDGVADTSDGVDPSGRYVVVYGSETAEDGVDGGALLDLATGDVGSSLPVAESGVDCWTPSWASATRLIRLCGTGGRASEALVVDLAHGEPTTVTSHAYPAGGPSPSWAFTRFADGVLVGWSGSGDGGCGTASWFDGDGRAKAGLPEAMGDFESVDGIMYAGPGCPAAEAGSYLIRYDPRTRGSSTVMARPAKGSDQWDLSWTVSR
jgi:hypothetical protein